MMKLGLNDHPSSQPLKAKDFANQDLTLEYFSILSLLIASQEGREC